MNTVHPVEAAVVTTDNREHHRRLDDVGALLAAEYTTASDVYGADNLDRVIGQVVVSPQATVDNQVSRRRFLKICGKTAFVSTCAVGGVVEAFKLDQALGEYVWPATEPKIHRVDSLQQRAPADQKHGMFFFGGFSVKDATSIGQALEPSLGAVAGLYGVEYDNRGIQIPDLATALSDIVTNDNLETVSFYGHSMGGDVALTTAIELLRKHPGLAIRYIMLDGTPTGWNDVRAINKDSGNWLDGPRRAANTYGGPIVRMAIELPNSPDPVFVDFTESRSFFIDASKLLRRMRVIAEEKLNRYAVSNRLALEQRDFIKGIAIVGTCERLQELTADQAEPYWLVQIRPDAASQDTTTDVDMAEQTLRQTATACGTFFTSLHLVGDNVHHADPKGLRDIYNPLLKDFLYEQACRQQARQLADLNQTLSSVPSRNRGEKTSADAILEAGPPPIHSGPTK